MKGLILFVILGGFTISQVYAQTAGTLTFSCKTNAPNGKWGTKHVLAAWIENTASPSVFIKTRTKYGNQDDHLTSWTAKSNKSLVDAVTGSTLMMYSTISGSWDGTSVAGAVVPDGTYQLYLEMGWGSNKMADHSVASFTFTKGSVAQHLTPNSTANYLNVVIDWNPVATLNNVTENFDNLWVYPNPTTGIVYINFTRELQGASVMVTNLLGKAIVSERNIKVAAGPKEVDLSTYPNGIYFITIQAANLKYSYKLLIKR